MKTIKANKKERICNGPFVSLEMKKDLFKRKSKSGQSIGQILEEDWKYAKRHRKATAQSPGTI